MGASEGADERKAYPSAAQLVTLAHVERSQKKLLGVVSAALKKHYTAARPRYQRFAEDLPHLFDDFVQQMPANPSALELAKRHPLQTIYVHPVVRDRLAYIGMSFNASWEVEHGVGVLLHGDRVVEIGGGDTAFLMWIAERDARPPRKQRKKAKTRKSKTKRIAKAKRSPRGRSR